MLLYLNALKQYGMVKPILEIIDAWSIQLFPNIKGARTIRQLLLLLYVKKKKRPTENSEGRFVFNAYSLLDFSRLNIVSAAPSAFGKAFGTRNRHLKQGLEQLQLTAAGLSVYTRNL